MLNGHERCRILYFSKVMEDNTYSVVKTHIKTVAGINWRTGRRLPAMRRGENEQFLGLI
jgi:hypothetical protein